MVISELDVGGAEKNFVNLALGLRQLGHQVSIYSLDPRPRSGRDLLVSQLEQAEIPVSFSKKSWSGWPNRTQVAWLEQNFRDQSAEIACSFLVRANLAAVLAGRRYRRDDKGASNPFPVVLGFRQAEPRFLVRAIEKWCLRRAAATVCVSRQVAQHYLGRRPTIQPDTLETSRPGQVLVIPNGVPDPKPTGPPPPDLQACFGPNEVYSSRKVLPVLLFVGRLSEQKGLDQLLSITPAILRQLPEFRLVLVGQGPMEHTLRAQAARLDCRDRIHFLGWRPNPLDFIQASTVVLLHSRWEGQPNAILEAMSLAKPFVTTNTHGVADIFGPELECLTTPPSPVDLPLARRQQVVASGNPAAYIDAVVSLAQDSEMAKNIGIWNQNHVQNHFSPPQFVTDYEQVFLMLAMPCQHPL